MDPKWRIVLVKKDKTEETGYTEEYTETKFNSIENAKVALNIIALAAGFDEVKVWNRYSGEFLSNGKRTGKCWIIEPTY